MNVCAKQTTLNEYLYRSNEVTDLTSNGKCSQCGACCSNSLGLTNKEIAQIRTYVAKHNIKPHVFRFPTSNRVLDCTCPFLDTNKSTERCKIYPVRPYICRVFDCHSNDMTTHLADIQLTSRKYNIIDMLNTFFPQYAKRL